MYGMDPDPDLEAKLRKAVDLIVKTQSPAGGWRYTPAPTDQDMSVTVMQIVALRAANNAEIPVPQADVREGDQVRAFAAAAPTGRLRLSGAGRPGRRPVPAALCRCNCSASPTTRTSRGRMTYLTTIPVQWGGGNPQYFYYFHYYAIQAFYQAGGKEWNDWHPRVRELLLEKQNKDGSWDVPPGSAEANLVTPTSKIYSTAMATLVLNIYMHYLPAYQR